MIIPAEWITCELGQIVENANGARTPISLPKRAEIQGMYPYYGATGQIDSLNDYTHEGEYVLIGEDGANLLSRSKNLAFIVRGKFWVNNHAHAVKALAGMPSEFIENYINSLNLTPFITGSAQPKLTKTNLQRIPFPVPPLFEQKAIAEKLDSLLAQVEAIKTCLEGIPEILKQFRQSVLAAAVSGELTEDWRGSETEYSQVTLGALAHDIRYGSSKKCSETEGAIPVLRIPNIGGSGIILNNLKYADFDDKEQRKLKLESGDLLLIRSNGSAELVGKAALVTQKDEHCLFAGYLIRVRLNMNKAFPAYVLIALKSPQLRQHIELTARSTSGVNNINSKELAALEIPLPLLKEQQEIVRRVEELFTFANKIETKAKTALENVNHLTQSILAQAFSGELTKEWREQNPDLISGENSAEALLERIKAEREKLKPVKKTRKKQA